MTSKKVKGSKEQFEAKDYDVSMDKCCWIACCPLTYGLLPYSTLLTLGPEEVSLKQTTICGETDSKRPYGELGSVERGNCCCFVNFASSFGPISPGCGCDGDLVDEIVAELKARQRGRGDQGQIERAEATLEVLEEINGKLDAIMTHLKMDRA